MKLNIKRHFTAAFAVLLLSLLTCSAAFADAGTLRADQINYNFNTKQVTAVGNVVLKRDGATVKGDYGEGSTETSEFSIGGSVTGDFPEKGITLKADEVSVRPSGTQKGGNVVEAGGKVRISRGKEWITASYIRWIMDTENYLARGNVDIFYGGKVIKAAEAERTGNKFRGKKVAELRDTKQNVTITSDLIEGAMNGDDLSEVVADGNVRIKYVDRDGLTTVLTGSKGIYSKARGTFVISGGAKAVRSDGKTVEADTISVREDTKDVSAIGNSRITFILQEKDKKELEERGVRK